MILNASEASGHVTNGRVLNVFLGDLWEGLSEPPQPPLPTGLLNVLFCFT